VGTPVEIYNQSATEFVCCFIGDSIALSPDLLQEAARQSGKTIEGTKKAYIRNERIAVKKSERTDICFSGSIKDSEYYGIYTKYTIQIGENLIKCVEKNDGTAPYKNGETMKIYLSFDDILLY
jgi:iron(III) transport system ATP-binding protein